MRRMFLWRASGAAAYNEGNGGHRRSGSGGRGTGYESRVFAASRAEIAARFRRALDRWDGHEAFIQRGSSRERVWGSTPLIFLPNKRHMLFLRVNWMPTIAIF